MTEKLAGCTRTTSSVAGAKPATNEEPIQNATKEMSMTIARVGQKAPDFTTTAYYKGGFKPVTLSEYLGKWVLLCFYPGDFTFV